MASAWTAAGALGAAVALAAWRLTPRTPARSVGQATGARESNGPRWWWRWRHPPATVEPFAAFLDALARELRVGAGLSGAFVAVTTLHPATHAVLGRAMRAVRDGQALGPALALATADAQEIGAGLADAAFVVQALRCVDTIGGPAAATLDAAASVLRERAGVIADAAAHSAQARLSARVLTIVPLGFAGWGIAASDQTRRTSLGTPLGVLCITAGLALNGLGWWWMRRIVGAARPAGGVAPGANSLRRGELR